MGANAPPHHLALLSSKSYNNQRWPVLAASTRARIDEVSCRLGWMENMRHLLRSLTLCFVTLTACHDPNAPTTTGRVTVRIIYGTNAPNVQMPAVQSGRANNARRDHLDTVRVLVVDTAGTIVRRDSGQPGKTLVIDTLPPGSYLVVVLGISNSLVEFYGQTNVGVVAGQTTTADVWFTSFRPVLTAFNSPTIETSLSASWSGVSHADGYVVEWDTVSSFANSNTLEVSGTECITVAVRREKLYDGDGKNILDYIDLDRYTLLPNTAGCYNAKDAVRTARLGREILLGLEQRIGAIRQLRGGFAFDHFRGRDGYARLAQQHPSLIFVCPHDDRVSLLWKG